MVDYLRALVAEAVAKSVVTHFAATCHWLFPRAGLTKAILEDEFTKQAFGWAALQLDDPKVAIRKAPRLCVDMIVALEVYVCSPSSPYGASGGRVDEIRQDLRGLALGRHRTDVPEGS